MQSDVQLSEPDPKRCNVKSNAWTPTFGRSVGRHHKAASLGCGHLSSVIPSFIISERGHYLCSVGGVYAVQLCLFCIPRCAGLGVLLPPQR